MREGRKVKPLIKWPGGKSSELKLIKQYVPEYDRYVEPFLGGGAVFFDLEPESALLGDMSKNLMSFYELLKIGDASMIKKLNEISEQWALLKELAAEQTAPLLSAYGAFRKNRNKSELKAAVVAATERAVKAIAPSGDDGLCETVIKAVDEKLRRTATNQSRLGNAFDDETLADNIVTGFLAGYYYRKRDELNKLERLPFTPSGERAAIFFFVREFCYGSMFRYNENGEFNIPYGGISYNQKDFARKIEALTSDETRNVLKNAELYTGDFENVLIRTKSGDFVFLDPPYDTEFSDYEHREFGRDEQKRLHDNLLKLSARFMLVIKKSDFIYDLYSGDGFYIKAFDNRYSCCTRGRNNREAKHLIITNYPT